MVFELDRLVWLSSFDQPPATNTGPIVRVSGDELARGEHLELVHGDSPQFGEVGRTPFSIDGTMCWLVTKNTAPVEGGRRSAHGHCK